MPRLRRPLVVCAAVALSLAACGDDDQLEPSPVDDTSDTASSDDVSEPADEADEAEPPDAEATAPASASLDGDTLAVEAVSCSEGPEVVAQFEDGGDLTVASDAEGTVTVRIVVADDGSSQAWATEAPATDVMLLPEGAEGEVTLTPVDVDGADDASREDVEVTFMLPCDAA